MKMKHSIRKKMTVIFSVVLLAAFGICWLVNNFFLERYYLRNKQRVLEQVYLQMDAASGENGLNDSVFVQELNSMCETNNISLFVMGRDGLVRLYSMRDYRIMQARLYASLFGEPQGPKEERTLKETSEYTIRTSRDVHMGGEYLEMTGVLAAGELFIVRTALEPIGSDEPFSRICGAGGSDSGRTGDPVSVYPDSGAPSGSCKAVREDEQSGF